MAKPPAGAGYHDPPLYLSEEAQRMPPEVQDWIASLGAEETWIAEFQLNLVGHDAFVRHWRYQRDFVAEMAKF